MCLFISVVHFVCVYKCRHRCLVGIITFATMCWQFQLYNQFQPSVINSLCSFVSSFVMLQ